MKALLLRNRSEKDLLRGKSFDRPGIVRSSEQNLRPDAAATEWSGSLLTKAASVDGPRPTTSSTNSRLDDAQSQASDSRPSSSRFIRSKLRQHASDAQLSTRARQLASMEDVPPVPAVPPTPAIIMTAPTLERPPRQPTLIRKKSKLLALTRGKQAPSNPAVTEAQEVLLAAAVETTKKRKSENRKSRFPTLRSRADPIEELRKFAGSRAGATALEQRPPSSLALPLPRKSESSRSDYDFAMSVSNSENGSSATTPISPDPAQSGRSFNWFPRRQKNRGHIFPLLSDRPSPQLLGTGPATAPATVPSTPRASTSGARAGSLEASPRRSSLARNQIYSAAASFNGGHPSALAASSSAATSVTFAASSKLLRNNSINSARSAKSSPALVPPLFGGGKGRTRSPTVGSASVPSEEEYASPTPPMAPGSGRNSTSTAGRSSLSNLFNLNNRLRNSDPHSPRQGSSGNGLSGTPGQASHSNSFNLSREAVSLPEREEGETAMQYLERVEDVVHRSQIPTLFSQTGDDEDDFRHAVMRSFMRKFAYFGDPLDMAIRKLLMEIDLPKETQQIDRVLQSFSDRYHECNPGIFPTADKAYFITFSILILQTDYFNKNNKRKMTKPDYIKNSSIEGISETVLECFYDNIVYTPFIRVEDDQDIMTMRTRKMNRKTARAAKAARAAIRNVPSDPNKKASKEPLDPYTLIFESKLDTLRPPLKEVIPLNDPYSYLGTASCLDRRLMKSSKAGIIQIESARSRPDAFMSPSGIQNPQDARVGLVDLPVDKVGVLWRKDPKKKTARSPWQEWGAILTGAGLYFFKNASWIKSYIHQFDHHIKHVDGGTLCFFKPPISSFKPDYMLPTDHSVALHDSTYRRHKNAFIFFRHSGSEEVFLADNESEMNDWLSKLNHQAAFKTAGIRQRGLLGGHYEGQRQRGMRRLESSSSTSAVKTVQTPTGEVTIQSGKIDHALAQQISAARQENMEQKIAETDAKLLVATKSLEDLLQDARHLFILAPIQQKTREQLFHAAARVHARLKWNRIEVWRMKCHRDILALDLEEERSDVHRRQSRIEMISGMDNNNNTHRSRSSPSPNRARTNGIDHDNSRASSVAAADEKVVVPSDPRPHANGSRPNTKSSQETNSLSTTTADGDEDFQTPPETTAPQTPIAKTTTGRHSPTPMATPAPSPKSTMKSPSINAHRLSVNSVASRLQPPAPRPSIDEPLGSPSASEYQTPMLDDAEAERQREERGDFPTERVDDSRPYTPDTPDSRHGDEHDKVLPSPLSAAAAATPDRRSRARHSFQRTLRDSATPADGRGHFRADSKPSTTSRAESRDSKRDGNVPSSAVLEEDGTGSVLSSAVSSTTAHASANSLGVEKTELQPESRLIPSGLKREKGSFTLHGKKASVVTFGGDWPESAEEVLLKMKATTASSRGGSPSNSTFDRDGYAPHRKVSVTSSKRPLSRSSSHDARENEQQQQQQQQQQHQHLDPFPEVDHEPEEKGTPSTNSIARDPQQQLQRQQQQQQQEHLPMRPKFPTRKSSLKERKATSSTSASAAIFGTHTPDVGDSIEEEGGQKTVEA